MGEMADAQLDDYIWGLSLGIDGLADDDYPKYGEYKVYRKKNPTHWKTKDGKVIKITDMTDSHLENSINLCARKKVCNNIVELLKSEKARREKIKHEQRLKSDPLYAEYHRGFKDGYNKCEKDTGTAGWG
jgi:hypothetical protein